MGFKARIDMEGLRFGRLVGLAFAFRDRSGHLHWTFDCDCGERVTAKGSNVRSGNTRSCGCLHRETSASRLIVHGHRAERRHGPTYRAWQELKLKRSSRSRRRTGGDEVCSAWRSSFPAFLADMGERPVGAVLTRSDARLPYSKTNCSWTQRASRGARAVEGWRSRSAAIAALIA